MSGTCIRYVLHHPYAMLLDSHYAMSAMTSAMLLDPHYGVLAAAGRRRGSENVDFVQNIGYVPTHVLCDARY
eukprot:1062498-Rhodomonas_salina.1